MSGGVCCFLHESMPSCAGQLLLPAGYLQLCYRAVRAAGGLCIADEVQSGYGRNGCSMWEFSRHGVLPDIVTCGKPMGGGTFPLAAVATSPAIAAAFVDSGVEYFNTQAGCNVAGAVGLAVLRVLHDERLMHSAADVGAYWLHRLRQLQGRIELIADVRGLGLFIGLELVTDRASLAPATAACAWIVNRCRALPCSSPAGVAFAGVLLSSDGPHRSVIKLKPPLTFSRDDADCMCTALQQACHEWQQQQQQDVLASS